MKKAKAAKSAKKAVKAKKAKAVARTAKSGGLAILVGTTKGAWILRTTDRRTYKISGPDFFGQTIYHLVADPRAPRTLLAAAKPGHLGPQVFRSTDFGRTWKEASKAPAFPKKEDGTGLTVSHVFWLTPGHVSEPGVWYAGTSPHAIFRSEDNGDTWEGVAGFNEHPELPKWSGGPDASPPGGKMTHSILIDPRDKRRMYVGLSGGGFFASEDQGASWKPLNKGVAMDFMPDELKEQEWGHDPHDVKLSCNPDRLYMQNHCGSYRLDRGGDDRWVRIGDNMPRSIKDIGFPVVVHPRDENTAWVFPMDGQTVWPRTSINGKPAAYVTRNAGKTWQRLDNGLPKEQAWYTVKRQCFCADAGDPVGLYFGTTSGDLWASRDEGRTWKAITRGLPQIYSVMTAAV